MTRAVDAGQIYTVSLANNANIATGGPFTGSMDGEFDWQVTTAIPEPATLLLLGSGLCVAVRRRIRH